MWRQLSGFEKFRFVACVLGLPVTVFGTILNAMEHRWVNAAIQAFLVFSFSYYLYKFATRGRGKGELQPDPLNPGTPPQQSSNPTVLIGVILAVIVLAAVGGFFGYKHFGKQGSPPTTVVAPAEVALGRLLLSPDQINTAMGTTGMTVDHNTTTMTDVSAGVSDQACRPLSGVLIAQAYAGSGWSAFREQVLTESGNTHTHSVDQGVVSFSSAHDAERVLHRLLPTMAGLLQPAVHRDPGRQTRSGADRGAGLQHQRHPELHNHPRGP